MKNTKLKTGAVETKTAELQTQETTQEKMSKIEAAVQRSRAFSKVTDCAAQSDLWMKNEPIPLSKEIWPHDHHWRYHYCDLYYPNAKGGAMYIDLPSAAYEVSLCEEKHRELFKKGVRYTYLKANEGEAELLARLAVLPLPQGAPQVQREEML